MKKWKSRIHDFATWCVKRKIPFILYFLGGGIALLGMFMNTEFQNVVVTILIGIFIAIWFMCATYSYSKETFVANRFAFLMLANRYVTTVAIYMASTELLFATFSEIPVNSPTAMSLRILLMICAVIIGNKFSAYCKGKITNY